MNHLRFALACPVHHVSARQALVLALAGIAFLLASAPAVAGALLASSISGNEGTGGSPNTLRVYVSSGNIPANQSGSVQYRLVGGTAVEGEDYTVDAATMQSDGSLGGELVWAAKSREYSASLPINVQLLDDNVDEDNETIIIRLSNASGAVFVPDSNGNPVQDGATNVTVTIRDSDSEPEVTFDSPSVYEGDSGETVVEFTATLSRPSSREVTIGYATYGGTAAHVSDYGQVQPFFKTFRDSTVTEVTFPIEVKGDTRIEENETIVIGFAGLNNARSRRGHRGILTILNDDYNLLVTAPEDVDEGATGSTSPREFTATITPAITGTSNLSMEVTAGYVLGGNATVNEDYTVPAGDSTVTFGTGETTKTITVVVEGDATVEADETVEVSLVEETTTTITVVGADDTTEVQQTDDSGTRIRAGAGTASFTIRNDDHQLSVTSPAVAENATGEDATLSFVATLNPAVDGVVSVRYTLSGSATAGADYTPPTGDGTLTFNPSETMKTIAVAPIDDDLVEEDETVEVALVLLTSPAGVTVGIDGENHPGVGTIQDDDRYQLSIEVESVDEGNANTVAMAFTVMLSPSPTITLSVDYRLGGTATAGEDYEPVEDGTLEFLPNETLKTITVNVIGDVMAEADETVTVTLSNASGDAIIRSDTAGGTIRNDDLPLLSIEGSGVSEGDVGAVGLVFTVTLAPSWSERVTVGYGVTGGTATAGTDYEDLADGVLVFEPGDTTMTVDVQVIGDDQQELDETVVITLSGAVNSEIRRAVGVGTIRSDELVRMEIEGAEVDEGGLGETSFLVFLVTLSAPWERRVTVEYAVAGGTAKVGVDYQRVTNGTLVFSPGDTWMAVAVGVIGDDAIELDETVVMTISNATGEAQIRFNAATGVIRNDDLPALSIVDSSAAEGDSGISDLVFAVTLERRWGEQITVIYSVTGGSAVIGEDYRQLADGMVTFAPGEITKSIVVTVLGDGAVEEDETVEITLTEAVNASIRKAVGIGTITNDDLRVMRVDMPEVNESDESETASLVFTATLGASWPIRVTVDYSLTGGTATEGEDYQALPDGTLVFEPNETVKTITVTVLGDDSAELDETVEITFFGQTSGVLIESGVAVGTIRSDDASTLFIDSPSVVEGADGETTALEFSVHLNPPSSEEVTVAYRRTGGTATADEDYESLAPGTLVFAAGVRTNTIQLQVIGDDFVEPDETVEITLSSPTGGAGIAQDSRIGTGTILRDLDRPALSVSASDVTEGETGETTEVRFDARLARPEGFGQSVSVDYEVRNLAASPSADPESEGTLKFGPGIEVRTVRLAIAGDSLLGADTRLVLRLLNPRSAGDGKRPEIVRESGTGEPGGTVTILDDDSIEQGNSLTYTLSAVGREVATSLVGVVWDRAESHRIGSEANFAMVGGRPLDATALVDRDGARLAREVAAVFGVRSVGPDGKEEDALGDVQWSEGGFDAWRRRAHLPDRRGLMDGTRFGLSVGEDAAEGQIKVWGQGQIASFGSDIEDGGRGTYSSEGDLFAGHFGVDYTLGGNALIGVALSRSDSSSDYRYGGNSPAAGETSTGLTSITPYTHWIYADEYEVWAASSFGFGSTEVKDDAGEDMSSISMLMFATGFRTEERTAGAYQVAAKADAFSATVSADGSDHLKAVEANSTRARFAVEAALQRAMGGSGVASARVDIGGRFDDGSAESGFGVDVVAKAGFASPPSGLEINGKTEMLLFHSQDGFQEWSFGAGLSYMPGGREQGIQLSLNPSWNGSLPDLEMAIDRRFAEQPARRNRGASLLARLAYGVDALQGRALATAYGEVKGSGELDGKRRLRIGAELRERGSALGQFRIELYGEREEAAESSSNRSLMLEVVYGR